MPWHLGALWHGAAGFCPSLWCLVPLGGYMLAAGIKPVASVDAAIGVWQHI